MKPLKEKEEDLAHQNTKTCHSSSTRQSTMIVATQLCYFFLFQTSVSTNQNVTSLGSIHHTVQRQSNCVCSVHNVLQLLEGDLTSRLHTVLCAYEACRPNQLGLSKILLNKWMDSTALCKQSKVNSPTPACS